MGIIINKVTKAKRKPGTKKKNTYSELLAICTELNDGQPKSLVKLFNLINGLREESGENLLVDVDELKGNHIRRLRDFVAKASWGNETVSNIKVKNGTVIAFEGILELFLQTERQNTIPEKVIEFVRGNLNYSLMNQIQNWLIDEAEKKADKRLGRQKSNEMEMPNKFISIEDSLYIVGTEAKAKSLEEQKKILFLAKSILSRCTVEITYLPNALNGEEDKKDSLIFSPEYLRRVGRKWLVYGMSKSTRFPNDENKGLYVNLVVSRIKTIKECEEPYQESGVDYSDDPFKDQITYHSFPLARKGECLKLQEVVLKVRKQKAGYVKNSYIYPFERIKQEPLHYSQRVIEEKEYADYGISKEAGYGYIVLNITDAPYIRPLLMTWGADLEVLSPPELRESMTDEIEAMQVMYGRFRQQ